MVEDTTVDGVSKTAKPNPVTVSVVGGAIGTIGGLKRGARAAIIGGVLGGTVGYLAATVFNETVAEAPLSSSTPISVGSTDSPATTSMAASDSAPDTARDGDADEMTDESEASGETGDIREDGSE